MRPWWRSAEWNAVTMVLSLVLRPVPIPGTTSAFLDCRGDGAPHDAAHREVVERARPLVPAQATKSRDSGGAGSNGAPSRAVLRVPGVDALTRLALAARDGDAERPRPVRGGLVRSGLAPLCPAGRRCSLPMTWPRRPSSTPSARSPDSGEMHQHGRGSSRSPGTSAWTNYGPGPGDAAGTPSPHR